jgi:hypothetical protein
MRPRDGEVLHFSEDPTITRFVPHVAATAQVSGAYVWAVDAARAPDYWFPRDCPRAMVWLEPRTTQADRARLLGPAARRVHVVEYGWLERIRTARLYAYRLGPAQPVGDLFALHEAAGIELRAVANLWPFWDAVPGSTVGFSAIRLRNARPRAS